MECNFLTSLCAQNLTIENKTNLFVFDTGLKID
jgi:hypothetical protein